MGTLFYLVYQFFQKHKVLFYGLLAATVLLCLGLASQLRLEEDITKVIPADEQTARANEVFQNTKFLDKIVMGISLADSSMVAPQQLIEYKEALLPGLQKLQPAYLHDIKHSVSNDEMASLMGTFFDQLPILYEAADYKELEEKLQAAAIEKTLAKNYRTLISPASIVLKKSLLKDPLSLAPNALKKLQTLQLDGNYITYNNHIFTEDKKHLFLFLLPSSSSTESGKNAEMVAGIDLAIDSSTTDFPGIKTHYFGAAAVAVGNAQQIKRDIYLTVAIAMTFLLLFISWFFRDGRSFFLIFMPAAFGALVGIAALYLFRGKVSVIALGVGSICLGVTLDFSLHLFTHFRHKRDIGAAIKDIASATLTSALTTGTAFLCLLFVHSNAMKDLGLYAAISVMAAALFAILVLPQWIGKVKNTKDNTLADKVASYPLHKNKLAILLLLGLFITSLFTYKNVRFENDMDQLNFMTPKLKTAENYLKNLSTVHQKSVFVIAEGKNLDAALQHSEALLPTLEKLQQKNLVSKYASTSKLLISKEEQARRIANWQKFWTAERIDSLAANFSLYGAKYKFKENAFTPFLDFLRKTPSPTPPRQLNEAWANFTGEYITEKEEMTTVLSVLKVDESAKPTVYQALEGIPHIAVMDKKYMMTRLVKILEEDFQLLVSLSLGLVFLILLLAFGRIELALMSYAPILLGWLITLGLMGLLSIQFNIINIILCTFIFGLGVDYSIFVSKGLLQKYTSGDENLPAYKTSILLSALTTIAGIGVLVFAKHPALRSIAVVSVIGILSVVLTSFVLLPILYKVFIFGEKGKRLLPFTLVNWCFTAFAYSFFVFGCLVLTPFGLLMSILPIPKETKKWLFHVLIMYAVRIIIYSQFHVKKRFENPRKEDFSKPALIIANHQSILDILILLTIQPKLIMVTNEWVWNSPFFGWLIKLADFYPIIKGVDKDLSHLEERVKQGYSIIIFPEGTRSEFGRMRRFKKGAFFLAEKLKLDILPLVLHGFGHTTKKGSFLVNKGKVMVKFLPRISPDNQDFGNNYSERAKQIGQYFRKEYKTIKHQIEDTTYYRDYLVKSFIYKGPILENYAKAKTKMEDNYSFFHKIIPYEAKIVDIGCGYGFLSYMLSFLSFDRNILGLDYDEQKIAVAKNCSIKGEYLQFEQADVTKYDLPESDVFIINDVLHYFPEEEQEKLISQCINKLTPSGLLIIRDGDSSMEERHKGTKLTEFFSTNFGFNKTEHGKLFFSSRKLILEAAKRNNANVEILDDTKFTSNIVYLIRQK